MQHYPSLMLILTAAMFGWGLSLPTKGQAQCGAPNLNRHDPAVLTIVNPKHREIPEQRARVQFLTACNVVAAEFHRAADEVKLNVTLVVEDGDEHYAIDKSGELTLHLKSWNDAKFVDAVIRGAIQQLTPAHTRERLLMDVLRRSDQIAPVSPNELKSPTSSGRLVPMNLPEDCITAAREEPCLAVPAHRDPPHSGITR